MLSETKVDDTFPTSQFMIDGFSKPYRLDRCSNGGGILIYVRNDINSRLITKSKVSDKIECVFIEIILRKKKWLLCCSYNPQKGNITSHMQHLSQGLDRHLPNYDNVLILGDFNSEPNDSCLENFCQLYGFSNLVNEPTCFKSLENPSCIDLFLTNRPKCFLSTTTIETGISDFHKMVITVLKIFYKKQKPKVILFRSYKNFDHHRFKTDLNNELLSFDFDNGHFRDFKIIVLSILDKYAPVKKKYIRANNSSFMNKELRKAIMKRSKLKNLFIKQKTESNRIAYNKQRNLCVSLLRKSKKDYFGKLDNKIVSDSRTFWKSVSPLFSKRSFQKESISLFENGCYVCEDNEIAEIFNTFFSNIVKELDLIDIEGEIPNESNISDPILKIIDRYENHSSVLAIKKEFVDSNSSFSFNFVDKQKISKEITKLDNKKSCQEFDIPVKIIKDNIDVFSNFLYNHFNNSLFNSEFPSEFKKADVIPIFKKKDQSNKENYRPISILPNLSKVYERCIYDQIYKYFDKIFSPSQCGFRKGYSAQNCLLVMIENWRNSLDKGEYSGAIMTDLSKDFDCLSHDLLIAKLSAYGFDYQSLKFIHSYLHNRKQRTKVNYSYSPYTKIDFGVPQGSILGPL